MTSLKIVICLLSMISTTAALAAEMKLSQQRIDCVQKEFNEETNEETLITRIGIDLNDGGTVSRIVFHRIETPENKAMDWTISGTDAKIKREVVKNVETVTVASGFRQIDLHFNAIDYSGIKGSTVSVKEGKNKKSLSTSGDSMLLCEGPLKFPNEQFTTAELEEFTK